MKRKRAVGVVTSLVLGLAVLCLGLVGLLAAHHQNDLALMKCERIAMAQGDDEASIGFEWVPPAWTCETDAGRRYLGFWLL